jgi:membrane-bound serine protease (ClpP class)
MDEVMSKKITSDAAAYIRSKAERRGRNAALAEQAVTESKSFTEKEALDARLIDLVVQDVSELVAVLDGREITRFDGTRRTLDLKNQQTRTVEFNWRQEILSAIARPEVLFLLLLGALAGLGAEISHPGAIFPGVLGVVCLVLFLFASQIIPINAAGVLLILIAIGLFIAEVKVASYGLLTVGGIVAMVLGAMMLVDAPIPEMRLSLAFLLPVATAMALWTIFLVRLVLRSQRRTATTGTPGLLGQHGLAQTSLEGGEGWVKVQGELWRATSEAKDVRAGDKVKVVAVDGLMVVVKKEA